MSSYTVYIDAVDDRWTCPAIGTFVLTMRAPMQLLLNQCHYFCLKAWTKKLLKCQSTPYVKVWACKKR